MAGVATVWMRCGMFAAALLVAGCFDDDDSDNGFSSSNSSQSSSSSVVSSSSESSSSLSSSVSSSSDSSSSQSSSASSLATVYVSDTERSVTAGQKVSVHSYIEGLDTDAATYTWEQIAGPKLTWLVNDAADATFIAPQVEGSELIAVKVLAELDGASVESTKVNFTVEPEQHLIVKSLTPTQRVNVGDTVRLHAQGFGASNPEWLWTQVSPSYPQVSIVDADTASPHFVAPNVSGQTFRFELFYRDGDSGASAVAFTDVTVHRPPTHSYTTALNLVPSQAIPVAIPVPPVVPANEIPPQALALYPAPDRTIIEGTSGNIAMTVTGGTPPYTYLWEQVSGPAASIAGEQTQLLSVTAPDVAAVETLTFKLTVTDDNGAGSSLTASARVQAVPAPDTSVPPTPVADIVTPMPVLSANVGVPLTISTELQTPVFTQTGGSLGSLSTPEVQGGRTHVNFTPAAITTNSESAKITITGTDSNGNSVHQIIPVTVFQAPGTEVVVAPPVATMPVPGKNPPLAAQSCGATIADEGQQAVVLGVCASGGTGTYQYQWQQEAPVSPVLALSDSNVSHPTVDAPILEAGKGLYVFQVAVTSGAETVHVRTHLAVENIASQLYVGAQSDLTVTGGTGVSLHLPTVTGGVPPYSWQVTQSAGPSVMLINTAVATNKAFAAPVLHAGAADEVLQFDITVSDSFLNKVETSQRVIVKAPVALAASISGPASANQGEAIHLNSKVSGGVAPYTYAYTVVGASLTVPATANPEVTLPSLSAGDSELPLDISLEVTDAHGDTVDAGTVHITVTPPAVAASSAVADHALAQATQTLSQTLAAPGGSADDMADDLFQAMADAAKDIPESELTATIVPPEKTQLLAGCGMSTDAVAADACRDSYVGGAAGACDASFGGMYEDPSIACWVLPLCTKSAGACQGVTPEMKAKMDDAINQMTQWFQDHPGCGTYLDPNC
ncbi:SprB repeat-containing protein [Gilvimarinus sp. DA14]|uniref:SprB repeat-containing protein n=1 Tax=Gilvimarinus sp. DA14 TaxID=2956798 RepID=UPI0020B77899|nr:SprB repeat-containing protein [Gilvimarinus sp. DA14]UTF60090.1 SprB repeat-containing protein [Gilvimarinus sp. DA14]